MTKKFRYMTPFQRIVLLDEKFSKCLKDLENFHEEIKGKEDEESVLKAISHMSILVKSAKIVREKIHQQLSKGGNK